MSFQHFTDQLYDAKAFVSNLNILPPIKEYGDLKLAKRSSVQLNDIRIDPKIHYPVHVKLPDGSIRIGPINNITGDIFMGCHVRDPSNVKSLFLETQENGLIPYFAPFPHACFIHTALYIRLYTHTPQVCFVGIRVAYASFALQQIIFKNNFYFPSAATFQKQLLILPTTASRM